MNHITNVVNMHYKSKFAWIITPWLWILLPAFAINLVIGLILGKDSGIYSGGLVSIFIYMFALGTLTVRETFPFALGFSIRRRDYLLGTLLMVGAVAAVEAIALLLLSLIESQLTGGWGSHLHFFHLPYVNDGPFIAQIWIYFMAIVSLYFLGFAPASVYQRFGAPGLLSFGVLLLLLATCLSFACTYFNWWSAIFSWLTSQSAASLASWLALPLAASIIFSYVLLRKATA